MIDKDGYRPNIGIIIASPDRRVFWARRCGQDGWQFPQGGIKFKETVEQALFRELEEEVGLQPCHVEVVGRTRDWLRYEIPEQFRRAPAAHARVAFKGQKQIWFLLRMVCNESEVRLDTSASPEFDAWRWTDYWKPVDEIVPFKRHVYRSALTELAPLLGHRTRECNRS